MTQPLVNYLKDYKPSDYLIEKVDLVIHFEEPETVVRSVLHLYPNPDVQTPGKLILNGDDIELRVLKLNGSELKCSDYTVDKESLHIHNPPATPFFLELTTHCKPAQNTTLSGLYKSGGMYCTQCESHGFRRITYMLDRPDVMATYTVKLIAEQGNFPILLANGNKVDSGRLPDGKHYVTWHDPFKKPSYLFAVVAGKLAVRKDEFYTCSGRKVSLEIYTLPQDIRKTDYAMGALKRAMKWDEYRFGREYDLDVYMIVAVPDFNMGAMENKGLNIFNTKYILADTRIATDKDFELVEAVVGHEYFHNWTGNRITCRDWFQLSLKEGLTVFRDQEFTSDLHDRTVKRIEDAKIIKSAQFAEDASPMAHPIRPASYIEMNNFYTVTVYNKGAEVIRMQYTLVGTEGFRKGMDLYFERHDGQAVTCDDFVAAIADANQLNLAQFKRWYHQAGTPIVQVKGQYDEEAKTYTLTLKQECPRTADGSSKEPFVIPVKMGLLSEKGQALKATLDEKTAHEHVLHFSQASQTFVFKNIDHKPIPSLLRDFSAPVKLKMHYTDRALATLMAHDENNYNRWEASQQLAARAILANVSPESHHNQAIEPKAYAKAFGTLLSQVDTISHAFLAELLQLPTLEALAEQVEIIHPNHLIQAYDAVKNFIAKTYAAELLAILDQLSTPKPYCLSQDEVAKRALKATLLSWLVAAAREGVETEAVLKRLLTQYEQADNMTDQLSALNGIVNLGDESHKAKILSNFYHRFEDEALVMDKWLSLQARASTGNVLSHVKTLMAHPAFSINNPNKVYALIGGFIHNMRYFHSEDGCGYEFLADTVIKLNHNPQVAARMVRGLMNYKRFEPKRCALMKQALERILHTENLAKDVYEIVSKSLQQAEKA